MHSPPGHWGEHGWSGQKMEKKTERQKEMEQRTGLWWGRVHQVPIAPSAPVPLWASPFQTAFPALPSSLLPAGSCVQFDSSGHGTQPGQDPMAWRRGWVGGSGPNNSPALPAAPCLPGATTATCALWEGKPSSLSTRGMEIKRGGYSGMNLGGMQ